MSVYIYISIYITNVVECAGHKAKRLVLSVSMVWVQILSREEQKFVSSNSNNVWFNFQTYIWHHWDTDYWWFQICHLHIWPECTSMQYIQDLNCLYFIHIHNGDFHHKHLVSTIKTIPPDPTPYIYTSEN
jgi:hypothetical protein